MPNALRRLPIAAEVNAFQAEVSRDQRLVTFGHTQNGAIIPDSQDRVFPAHRALKPPNELPFRKRHGKRVQGTGGREQSGRGTERGYREQGTGNSQEEARKEGTGTGDREQETLSRKAKFPAHTE